MGQVGGAFYILLVFPCIWKHLQSYIISSFSRSPESLLPRYKWWLKIIDDFEIKNWSGQSLAPLFLFGARVFAGKMHPVLLLRTLTLSTKAWLHSQGFLFLDLSNSLDLYQTFHLSADISHHEQYQYYQKYCITLLSYISVQNSGRELQFCFSGSPNLACTKKFVFHLITYHMLEGIIRRSLLYVRNK